MILCVSDIWTSPPFWLLPPHTPHSHGCGPTSTTSQCRERCSKPRTPLMSSSWTTFWQIFRWKRWIVINWILICLKLIWSSKYEHDGLLQQCYDMIRDEKWTEEDLLEISCSEEELDCPSFPLFDLLLDTLDWNWMKTIFFLKEKSIFFILLQICFFFRKLKKNNIWISVCFPDKKSKFEGVHPSP